MISAAKAYPITNNERNDLMNELERFVTAKDKESFDETRLNRNEYTSSLLREAVRIGALTEDEALELKLKIFNYLAEVIDEYTDGRSQSVKNDRANDLLSSLYYNIDAKLISLKDPQKALDALRDKSIGYLYDNGGNCLKRSAADCAALLFKIKRSRLVGATEAYNRTIDEDVKLFIKDYNIRFGAHQNPATMRYKTALPPVGSGINRLKRYLANLLCENTFCRSYASDEVINVVSFEVMRSSELNRDISNLYIPVLLCAVICQFLMPGVPHVLLSEEDVNNASTQLEEYSPDELKKVLSAAFSRLPDENSFYHQKVFEAQLPGLVHSIKHGNLKTMIAYMPINSSKKTSKK